MPDNSRSHTRIKEIASSRAVDIRRYAKYLLEEGAIEEKRMLLEHLKGKLTLLKKKIGIGHSTT